jgi:hypothetical protein
VRDSVATLGQEVTMPYTASCHCGKVKLEIDGQINQALACNCSICSRKGSLLCFVPRSAVKWLTPDANAAIYTFNKHVIKHRFCAQCGIHPFAEAVDRAGTPTVAVNLRCVEGLDLSTVKVTEFDGRSL